MENNNNNQFDINDNIENNNNNSSSKENINGSFTDISSKSAEKKNKKRKVIIIILAVILPALFVFIWKQIEIHKLRKNYSIEINMIKEDTAMQVKIMNENNIKLVSRILSWAVSDAIKSGRKNDAINYMILTVKEKNFKQIHVVDMNGIVILSTDKKMEGSPFINPFPDEAIPVDSVKLRLLPSGEYIAASSMYNVDTRHGVLVITVLPDTLAFKTIEK